jgi:hypothetical protein
MTEEFAVGVRVIDEDGDEGEIIDTNYDDYEVLVRFDDTNWGNNWVDIDTLDKLGDDSEIVRVWGY